MIKINKKCHYLYNEIKFFYYFIPFFILWLILKCLDLIIKTIRIKIGDCCILGIYPGAILDNPPQFNHFQKFLSFYIDVMCDFLFKFRKYLGHGIFKSLGDELIRSNNVH